MATSRTGTSEYKRWRSYVLREAERSGQHRCPYCGVTLDYRTGRLPQSAEPDHVTAWAAGGTNTVDNGRAICRRCNQSKGARAAPRPRTVQAAAPLRVSRRH